MKHFSGLDTVGPDDLEDPVCSVGVFDGVHRGHRQLLYELRMWAQTVKGTSCVLTFDRHPLEVLSDIEVPAILTHQISLYRAYCLAHQKHTQLSILPRHLEQQPAGPYVSLFETLWYRRTGADYLIVHYDLPREYDRYWRFMLEREPTLATGRDAGFIRGKKGPPVDDSLDRLRMGLRRQFGDPF